MFGHCPFTRSTNAFFFSFSFLTSLICLVLVVCLVCSVLTCTALWASCRLLTEGFSPLEMFLLSLLLLRRSVLGASLTSLCCLGRSTSYKMIHRPGFGMAASVFGTTTMTIGTISETRWISLFARFVLVRPIKMHSFNPLCVLDLLPERW